jgi:hypothetical protein
MDISDLTKNQQPSATMKKRKQELRSGSNTSNSDMHVQGPSTTPCMALTSNITSPLISSIPKNVYRLM